MLFKRFILNSDFHFFFFLSKNLFFLRHKFTLYFFLLPSFFFYFFKDFKFSFFFHNKFFFKSFLAHFKTEYIKLFFFFFSKFKLRGLGYRIKHLTRNFIRFFMGTTNFYYLHSPGSFFVRAKRRRIFLFSSQKSLLKIVSLKIISLKKIIPYKLRGFFFPRQFVLMKPGKKRF